MTLDRIKLPGKRFAMHLLPRERLPGTKYISNQTQLSSNRSWARSWSFKYILKYFFQTTNRIILVSAKKLARSVAVVVRCNKFEKRKMKKSFYSLSKKVLSFARFPKSSKFKKRNSFLENENHACFALFSQKSCTITGFFRNFLKRLICAGKGHLFGHLNLAEKSKAKLKFEATFLNSKNFIDSNLRF